MNGLKKRQFENQQLVDMINQSATVVLRMFVGSKSRGKWIIKHRGELSSIKIFLAIGTTIDFEVGKTQNSPRWLSEIGLEWLYRITVITTMTMEEIFIRYNSILCFANTAKAKVIRKSLPITKYFRV
jgi:exopolysaccharide biosynthesis WecB/TagA/CpsF family protein